MATSYDWEDSNRRTVLEGREALIRTGESIERSQRIAIATEEIGSEIVNELGVQRESLERTRRNLRETDEHLTQSQRLLSLMKRRILTNKFILVLVIVLEIGVLVGVVYLKYFKRK